MKKLPDPISLERFFRVLEYLISGWSKFSVEIKRQAKKNKGSESSALRAIETDQNYSKYPFDAIPIIHFEKLATFVYRIWNDMFRYETKKLRDEGLGGEINQEQRQIKYGIEALREIPAKHGRRVVRLKELHTTESKDHEIHTLTNMIVKLDSEEIGRYFLIKKPGSEKNAEDTLNTEDHKSYVLPGSPIPDADIHFGQNFSNPEIALIDELDNVIRTLNRDQIRAIGTHENTLKTIADIKKEFRDLRKDLENCITKLKEKESFYIYAKSVHSYLDEAERKSLRNKKSYESAYNKIKLELKREDLKRSFLSVQDKPSDIWENVKIKEYATFSSKYLRLMDFVTAVAYYRDNKDARKKALKLLHKTEVEHRFENGLQSLLVINLNLQNDIANYFVGESDVLNPSVNEKLIRLLSNFREELNK